MNTVRAGVDRQRHVLSPPTPRGREILAGELIRRSRQSQSAAQSRRDATHDGRRAISTCFLLFDSAVPVVPVPVPVPVWTVSFLTLC